MQKLTSKSNRCSALNSVDKLNSTGEPLKVREHICHPHGKTCKQAYTRSNRQRVAAMVTSHNALLCCAINVHSLTLLVVVPVMCTVKAVVARHLATYVSLISVDSRLDEVSRWLCLSCKVCAPVLARLHAFVCHHVIPGVLTYLASGARYMRLMRACVLHPIIRCRPKLIWGPANDSAQHCLQCTAHSI